MLALEDLAGVSVRSSLLLSLSVLLLLLHLWLQAQRRPPGPFPWPVVGNAPQMGAAPHRYFSRLARRYGDVFQIRLGSRAVVVLNGDAIRRALVQKGADFAGRPDFTSFRVVSDGRSMAFGDYGPRWKLHRRVAHAAVRALSAGDARARASFERHVLSEVTLLLRRFLRRTAEETFFQPHADCLVSTANIMSALCFGSRYSHDDREFRQVVGRNADFTRTVGAGSIVDVMPWLQYFPNPIQTLYRQFTELNREFSGFVRGKVAEHRRSAAAGVTRDMTDALIFALDKGLGGAAGAFLGGEYVSPTISDIFGASQDTLSTALHWIVLILVRYPEVQTQLRVEVDKVVARSRLPTIEDQARLPYVMAFIYEVMRFTSFVPITIPHSTTSDTSIDGYHIPKNTVVFINQWSNNHNPAKWDRPEVFNPLRFMSQDDVLDKDLASNVLIFSVGKRRCIGEDLSKIQLFLFTSLLVHQCTFTADPSQPLRLDYEYGLTLKPNPYRIAVTLRDSMDLLKEAVEPQPRGDGAQS
ncbi:cytochrome P450 1B1 [Denticeps clupeoides]|uniref:Unspecific monooxygenase n=1 Tax=Denticeps clupeoides TaxID=299321 RepID=A0AAY4EHH2_9TELE|nr:cytochrome P450 1B1 [Denticeps clupeoides]XP_028844737.1 cytochrome P450 1B1 [Denticeps clupeoides]